MTRSADALRRRAEKRNLTVDEMKVVEMSRSSKRSKVSDGPDKTKSDDRWKCGKCNNRNFMTSELCNRCQRPRNEVDEGVTTVSQSSTPQSSECKKKSEPVPDSVPKKPADSTKRIKKDNIPKESHWNVEQASAESVLEAQRLRDMYMDPQQRLLLSKDMCDRAEILIARSQRKKEKKKKLHAAIGHK